MGIELRTEKSAMYSKSTSQLRGISAVHSEVYIHFDYGEFVMT
jgi:hypothetical protein